MPARSRSPSRAWPSDSRTRLGHQPPTGRPPCAEGARRPPPRLPTTVTLRAASVSWAGWVLLHTAGDPGRSDRIAHAVLDDPRARRDVANDIAAGIAAA